MFTDKPKSRGREKMILATFLLAYTTIGAWAAVSGSGVGCAVTCEDLPNGFYPACTSCHGFVSCSDGVATAIKCPSGMEWSDRWRTCKPETAECVHEEHDLDDPKAPPKRDKGPLHMKMTAKQAASRMRKLIERLAKEKAPGGNEKLPVTPTKDETAAEYDLLQLSSGYQSSDETNRSSDLNSEFEAKKLLFPNTAVFLEGSEGEKTTAVDHVVPVSTESGDPSNTGFALHPEVETSSVQPTTSPVLPDGQKGSGEETEAFLGMQSAATNSKEPSIEGDCLFHSDEAIAFDGRIQQLKGNCKHVAAKVCGNSSDLVIEFQLRTSTSDVTRNQSVVYFVDVKVKDSWARLHSVGVAFADGEVVPPGQMWTNPNYRLVTGPDFSILQTEDGVIVSMDRKHTFNLYIPAYYNRPVCGICGPLSGETLRMDGVEGGQHLGWKTVDQQNPKCVKLPDNKLTMQKDRTSNKVV